MPVRVVSMDTNVSTATTHSHDEGHKRLSQQSLNTTAPPLVFFNTLPPTAERSLNHFVRKYLIKAASRCEFTLSPSATYLVSFLSKKEEDRKRPRRNPTGNKREVTTPALIILAECAGSVCPRVFISLWFNRLKGFSLFLLPLSKVSPPTSHSTWFQSWWSPQGAVCLPKLSEAVCQSHIHSRSLGGKQSRMDEGESGLMSDGHLTRMHVCVQFPSFTEINAPLSSRSSSRLPLRIYWDLAPRVVPLLPRSSNDRLPS